MTFVPSGSDWRWPGGWGLLCFGQTRRLLKLWLFFLSLLICISLVSISHPQKHQTVLFSIVSGFVSEPSAAIFSWAGCSIKMPHVESRASRSGRGLCNLPENNLKPLKLKNNNSPRNEFCGGGTGALVWQVQVQLNYDKVQLKENGWKVPSGSFRWDQ